MPSLEPACGYGALSSTGSRSDVWSPTGPPFRVQRRGRSLVPFADSVASPTALAIPTCRTAPATVTIARPAGAQQLHEQRQARSFAVASLAAAAARGPGRPLMHQPRDRPERSGYGDPHMIYEDLLYLRRLIDAGLIRSPCLETGAGLDGSNVRSELEGHGIEWHGTDLKGDGGRLFALDLEKPPATPFRDVSDSALLQCSGAYLRPSEGARHDRQLRRPRWAHRGLRAFLMAFALLPFGLLAHEPRIPRRVRTTSRAHSASVSISLGSPAGSTDLVGVRAASEVRPPHRTTSRSPSLNRTRGSNPGGSVSIGRGGDAEVMVSGQRRVSASPEFLRRGSAGL